MFKDVVRVDSGIKARKPYFKPFELGKKVKIINRNGQGKIFEKVGTVTGNTGVVITVKFENYSSSYSFFDIFTKRIEVVK